MAAETIVTIVLSLENNPEAIVAQYFRQYIDERGGKVALANLLAAVASGVEIGKVCAFADAADGTPATDTIACTQANCEIGNTVTISGVVFTVASSPSTNPADGQFAALTSDTVTGAALAAAINAHPALKGLVTAVAATGTVTLTVGFKGAAGNNLAVSTNHSHAFAIGSARPTNGAAGTTKGTLRCYRGGVA